MMNDLLYKELNDHETVSEMGRWKNSTAESN